jgi:hypothetical protein
VPSEPDDPWAGWQPVAHCHHPIADRYIAATHVQVCGWCGSSRFAREADRMWPAVTKPSREVRDPSAQRVEGDDRSGRGEEDRKPPPPERAEQHPEVVEHAERDGYAHEDDECECGGCK